MNASGNSFRDPFGEVDVSVRFPGDLMARNAEDAAKRYVRFAMKGGAMRIFKVLLAILLFQLALSQDTQVRKKYVSPKKYSYDYRSTGYQQDYETIDARAESKAPEKGKYFAGTDRKYAKTSYVERKDYEKFPNLEGLIATLPPDEKMLNHVPKISKSPDSHRVTEEERNVMVNAFIYAITREKDNDYHIIIGSDPKRKKTQYFNVEVTGLPTSGKYLPKLKQIRATCEAHLADVVKSSGYYEFDQPILVSVGGSLFYDIDHRPGAVGPQGKRPKTAWEIHPVTFLVFEPKLPVNQ